jgi:hypothetical protein
MSGSETGDTVLISKLAPGTRRRRKRYSKTTGERLVPTPTLERRGDYHPLSLHSRTIKTRASGEGGGKKRSFYRPLPVQFSRDGFNYRQIVREKQAAIYEQTWLGCPNPSICYEIIRIKRRKGFEIDGRFVEPAEVYPNSDAWGVDGFTCTDKDAAFAKLTEVSVQ